MKESPIFTKTYDFLRWITLHVARFPKSERFRLAKRIEDSAYTFYEQILMAARHPEGALNWLTCADDELARLRVYLRLAKDHGFASMRQYQHASGLLVEIGKLPGQSQSQSIGVNASTCWVILISKKKNFPTNQVN